MKIEYGNYSSKKFWTNIHVRLAAINQKRVYLSRMSPINKSTINNQVHKNTWPSVLQAFYYAKVLDTTVETLVEESLEEPEGIFKK